MHAVPVQYILSTFPYNSRKQADKTDRNTPRKNGVKLSTHVNIQTLQGTSQ